MTERPNLDPGGETEDGGANDEDCLSNTCSDSRLRGCKFTEKGVGGGRGDGGGKGRQKQQCAHKKCEIEKGSAEIWNQEVISGGGGGDLG